MRYLGWLVKAVIFVLLLGFALKNSDVVTVHYYLDYVWEAPLVLILLGFFAMGAATGLLAMMPHLIRQRRELGKLRKVSARQADSTTLVQENL
ncbi:MAG TPA: LapA family protein [Thiobacillaceae bacterium]|nr:LapA family protein [Thiobacillaceae bacterium]